MSIQIVGSLAGTDRKYAESSLAQGFRLRKLHPSEGYGVRIHVEAKILRLRLGDEYKTKYVAFDLPKEGLAEVVNFAGLIPAPKPEERIIYRDRYPRGMKLEIQKLMLKKKAAKQKAKLAEKAAKTKKK